jgi:adenylate cyclase
MKTGDVIEIARRIVDEGLAGAPRHQLLGDLSARMVDAGVPLQRAYVVQPTLHPVIGAHGFEWLRREEKATQQDFARRGDVPSDMWLRSPFHHMMTTEKRTLRRRLEDSNQPSEFPMLDELREQGATDYYAVATSFGDGGTIRPIRGILSSWTSDRPGGFGDDDIDAIDLLLPVLALAIKAATAATIATNVAETYLGRDAGQRVLSGEIQRGSVETIRAVLWYCDLQGFTKIADSSPRDQLIPLLNDYFEVMVKALEGQGGQVLKFMGDGLMAIFRLDEDDDERVCNVALDAAEQALAGVAELSATRAAAGLPVTEFSLALHLGEVMYGNVGSLDRLDFTVVGPAVNEVSRIEAMCGSLDRALIISSAFAAAAGRYTDRLASLGRYALRGVRRPQELYTLVGVDDAEVAAP